jgi:NSS family neurotransmitter:Na+ symporter
MTKDRGSFSRIGFILAAAGSAVGLGNLWKFSYITFQNNGGSFVLIYLLSVIIVGFPIMMAEIVIGRSTQKSPVGAFRKLAHPSWSFIGWLGIITGFVILSYYSVVAGWTVHYFIECVGWSVSSQIPQDSVQATTFMADHFSHFCQDGFAQVGFHGFFMVLSVLVVVFGIRNGIERITKVLMPVLLGILIILLINSFWTPGFKTAITKIFKPTPLQPGNILEAVGQAFFSLSLGMGAIITYGSYMSKRESVPKAALMVCLLDTLIALMACVIIFSIIYSSEAQMVFQEGSIGILFTAIPKMFYTDLVGGKILAPLFFLLVAFAALTSTISLLEVVVSFFIDQLNWSRVKSTVIVGVAIFCFGVLSALSLGSVRGLSRFDPLGLGKRKAAMNEVIEAAEKEKKGSPESDKKIMDLELEKNSLQVTMKEGEGLENNQLVDRGINEENSVTEEEPREGFQSTLDYLATNWFLPIGGILIAIFTGWILKGRLTREELEEGHGRFVLHRIWRFFLRFIVPLAVGWVIYSVIFMGKMFN